MIYNSIPCNTKTPGPKFHLNSPKPRQVLDSVGENDNMNQILDFFSYEHFYVIYCKFWALDGDHDLLINAEELSRHDKQGHDLNKSSN